MPRVHTLACVHPAAQIADNVEIGPFCVIGAEVHIAGGCRLISHVHVEGRTRLGARTVVYPHAVLGTAPQSVSYRGEPTELIIGEDCQIRESVTMNIGTQGGGVTRVGNGGFFMAYSHVAHDCIVGDDVVLANSATLAGHCEIGDNVFIGGLSAVHQFTRIGAHAMIGGVSGIRGDVIPFGIASGEHARMQGINVVGMKRRNFTAEAIAATRRAYRRLFFGAESLEARLEATEAELGHEPAVAAMVSFIRTRGTRVLSRPTGAPGQ